MIGGTGLRLALLAAALGGVEAQRPAEPFRSTAEGVSVPVTVRDRGGPVGGLTSADFELRDNGVVQTVAAGSLEALPFDVSLVLDTSGSVDGPALERLVRDVYAIRAAMRRGDRMRVLTFDGIVRELIPMQDVGQAVPRITIRAGGTTALFHALVAALQARPEAGRPHLVVALTDGFDTMSVLGAADVYDLARRADAVLHVVVRHTAAIDSARRGVTRHPRFPRALARVRDAAELTGGRTYLEDVQRPLPELFLRALADFRASYLLWFTPQGVSREGWHDLRVRVKSGEYTVTARQGYFAGSR